MPNVFNTATYRRQYDKASLTRKLGKVSGAAWLSLSLVILSLTACQNAPSNVTTTPTKPVITSDNSMQPPQSQTQEGLPSDTQSATSSHTVVIIDVPPTPAPESESETASEPTVSSSVIVSPSTQTTSQNTADILTAPSDADNQQSTSNSPQSTTDDSIPLSTKPTEPIEPTTRTPSTDVVSRPVQPPTRTPTATPSRPDRRTPQEILLERARANSRTNQTTRAPTLENGDNVPAFRRLMQTGIGQLQNGDYNAADSTFTRAQRLAPQSSAVYFYLGQVAIKRNQPRRAEAMARRGLVVAQTDSRRRNLWQVILIAGEQQQSERVITEAKAALNSL